MQRRVMVSSGDQGRRDAMYLAMPSYIYFQDAHPRHDNESRLFKI